MDRLKLAWLYPDTLNLYGDRGNVLALSKIAEAMGLDFKVDKINLGDKFDPLEYDLIYIPSGETIRAESVINDLNKVKQKLNTFINEGRPLLVTGNSIIYFGKEINKLNGETVKGLDLININSSANDTIYGDDIYLETPYNHKLSELIGIQIVMNDIVNNGEKPFGKLLYGYGYDGKGQYEGIQKNNAIFTTILGPLLTGNPWLAKELLTIAANNRGVEIKNSEPDFSLEEKSFKAKQKYIKNKDTNLTNVKH